MMKKRAFALAQVLAPPYTGKNLWSAGTWQIKLQN
jgi:hypothetical protein